MKTIGMPHQQEALRRMNGREHFALFMEQGTGKTWTLLADAERLYRAGEIDAMLVLAPNGVHLNWALREIPAHLEVEAMVAAWDSGMGKRRRASVEALLRPRDVDEVAPFRILAMSWEAICTKDGFAFATRFLNATRAMIAADESHRIKTPTSLTHKRALLLRSRAKIARIATGTPITNAPLDVFGQMEFLESGLLGTTSRRAFIAEYSELLAADHPMLRNIVQRNPRAAMAQIVARNSDGSPRYRNLDKLQRLVAPHAYRVLKRECLSLPEKIYQQALFELPAGLRSKYDEMEADFRITLADDTVATVSKLAAMTKLQQITSCFVILEGEPRILDAGKNPRLATFMDVVEGLDGPFIVWAKFREELAQVATALRRAGITAVEYHGDIGRDDRNAAVDAFQSGTARAFVGQPKAGGVGLTLTAAETVIYFSNDYNMGVRVQSEDRAHRIGTRRNVVYIDIVARDTIDSAISRALQRKSSMAAAIMADRNLETSRVYPDCAAPEMVQN